MQTRATLFVSRTPSRGSAKAPTHSGAVEGAREHQHDVVGPVLLVNGHLVLLDDQHVQVAGAVHGVEQVEEPVFVPAGRRGEGRAFYVLVTLGRGGERREGVRRHSRDDSPPSEM